jgi:hypothetical protein
MHLANITFTGADDTVQPALLEEVSTYFPFVEWGILFPSTGGPRFPSRSWVNSLQDSTMNLSAHLCGTFVTSALNGNISTFVGITGVKVFNQFKRMQINTHGLPVTMDDVSAFTRLVDRVEQEIIVQMDGTNDWVAKLNTKTAMLFDTSSGAGRSPAEWPEAVKGRKCGYAGGLGPENLKAELEYLNYFLPEDAVIWVDMESNIRDNKQGHSTFSINKVLQCAEIAAPFIDRVEDVC